MRWPPGAGAVVTDEHRRVLLLWRHRFITDTWGWEIPVGRVEPGEGPAQAAGRDVEEETGWRPGPLRPLLRIEPTPGISASVRHVYRPLARARTVGGVPSRSLGGRPDRQLDVAEMRTQRHLLVVISANYQEG